MVGCVFTHSSPAMAVFGTKTPLIGTNPIAIAIPAGDHLPIVLDMSTSVVARGKIRYAALTGQSIPLGWARDTEGKPTQDAKLALKGSLEPVGGAKGSALSLIIDLICGVLTNTVLTGGVKNVTDMSGPAQTGHFFSALDVSQFHRYQAFQGQCGSGDHQHQRPPRCDRRGADLHARGDRIHPEKKRMAEGIPLDRGGDAFVEQRSGPLRGCSIIIRRRVMDFGLSEELTMLQGMVRGFAAGKIAPFADEWDAKHYFPYEEVVKPMAELGLFGTVIPEEYGGNNMGWLAAIDHHRGDRPGLEFAPGPDQHAGDWAAPIRSTGTGPKSSRRSIIAKLVNAEILGAFAITEPQAGSDVMAIKSYGGGQGGSLAPQRDEDLDLQRDGGRDQHLLCLHGQSAGGQGPVGLRAGAATTSTGSR